MWTKVCYPCRIHLAHGPPTDVACTVYFDLSHNFRTLHLAVSFPCIDPCLLIFLMRQSIIYLLHRRDHSCRGIRNHSISVRVIHIDDSTHILTSHAQCTSPYRANARCRDSTDHANLQSTRASPALSFIPRSSDPSYHRIVHPPLRRRSSRSTLASQRLHPPIRPALSLCLCYCLFLFRAPFFLWLPGRLLFRSRYIFLPSFL